MDVEKSTAMDFSETIEVKVYDKEDHFSVDSYFFAYFHDLPVALEQIRDAVRSYRASPQAVSSDIVLDTTHRGPAQGSHAPLDRTRSLPLPDTTPGSGGFSLTSLLKPFQDMPTFGRTDNAPAAQVDAEDFTHISKRSSFVPITSSPPPMSPITATTPAVTTTTSVQPESQKASNVGAKATKTASLPLDHTYPPSMAPSLVTSQSEGFSGSYWTVGVPSWLKGSSKKIFSIPFGSIATSSSSSVSEVYQSASNATTAAAAQNDLGYSILETLDSIDVEIVEKFRSSFAFDERETLLGCTSCLSFGDRPF